MKDGFVTNPDDEFVANLKRRIKDNGGYCIYQEKRSKGSKCPKACKSAVACPCGMYIPETIEGYEYDLD